LKKICISANSSWYLYNFRKNLISKMIYAGYEVIVLAPTDKYSACLKAMNVEFHNIRLNPKSLNPFLDISLFLQYYIFFKNNSPDIILQYTIKPNIYGSLAAYFRKIPVINNIAGLGSLFTNVNVFTSIAIFLYKISQKNARVVFFQNEDDQNLFLKNGIITKSQCCRLPGSGVDITRFVPKPTADTSKFHFLLASRMIKEKGIYDLIEAGQLLYKLNPNFHIFLVGFLDVQNPHSISHEEMSHFQQLSFISYLGVSDKIENEYENAHCVVLPSYYREGVPRTLLEATAMGIPIITTNSVGCRDAVIPEYNGYLCPPKNPIELANTMLKIMTLSSEQYAKMRTNSRQLAVERFDETIVINKYLEKISYLL
jgi:glycosyltransferase involved in cell wall biosynthesis